MMSTFSIYLWPIIAALICGATLALIGTQISARRQETLVLVVNQATVSVYLFLMLGINIFTSGLDHSHIGSLANVTAVTLSVVLLKLAESIVPGKYFGVRAEQTVIFMGLLCLSHLFASSNSGFEGQFLRSLMGDVVLLSDDKAYQLILFGSLALIICLAHKRNALTRSFVRAILGTSERDIGLCFNRSARIYETALLGFVCLCTIEMGFLFTSAAILVPTKLMSVSGLVGFRSHVIGVVSLWLISCFAGFSASLVFVNLPTAPAIGAALFILGTFFNVIVYLYRNMIGKQSSAFSVKV